MAGEAAAKVLLSAFPHLHNGGAQLNSSRARFYCQSFFERSESVAVKRDQSDLCRHVQHLRNGGAPIKSSRASFYY